MFIINIPLTSIKRQNPYSITESAMDVKYVKQINFIFTSAKRLANLCPALGGQSPVLPILGSAHVLSTLASRQKEILNNSE